MDQIVIIELYGSAVGGAVVCTGPVVRFVVVDFVVFDLVVVADRAMDEGLYVVLVVFGCVGVESEGSVEFYGCLFDRCVRARSQVHAGIQTIRVVHVVQGTVFVLVCVLCRFICCLLVIVRAGFVVVLGVEVQVRVAEFLFLDQCVGCHRDSN